MLTIPNHQQPLLHSPCWKDCFALVSNLNHLCCSAGYFPAGIHPYEVFCPKPGCIFSWGICSSQQSRRIICHALQSLFLPSVCQEGVLQHHGIVATGHSLLSLVPRTCSYWILPYFYRQFIQLVKVILNSNPVLWHPVFLNLTFSGNLISMLFFPSRSLMKILNITQPGQTLAEFHLCICLDEEFMAEQSVEVSRQMHLSVTIISSSKSAHFDLNANNSDSSCTV